VNKQIMDECVNRIANGWGEIHGRGGVVRIVMCRRVGDKMCGAYGKIGVGRGSHMVRGIE